MPPQQQQDDYEKALRQLVKLLRKGYATAAQIATEMGCSKMVAYRRLRALSERDYTLRTQLVREGSSGPKALAYTIARSR